MGSHALPRLFINYRSEDTGPVAATLCRELVRRLALGDVFLDHRGIEPGEPWPERLRGEVEGASIVFALIGRQWLTLQGPDGIRRLDDPEDWVRTEIEVALTIGKLIVPVLVDGAVPLVKNAFRTIPQIEALADKQGVPLSTREWDAHFEALLKLLEKNGFRRHDPLGPSAPTAVPPPFRSTVPARGRAPFEGREALLQEIAATLAEKTKTQLVVLFGPSGVGKSELARELARRHRGSYPGGTFVVDVRSSGPPVDLIKVGRNVLQLPLPAGLSLEDQCLQSLLALGASPCLLIYDNALNPGDLEPWLPPDGMPCHVIVTSTWERWDQRWSKVPVPPLSDSAARVLVEKLTSPELAARYGAMVVQQGGGLPVQLVPAARSLQHAVEHGRTGAPAPDLADEARASFTRPWAILDENARLLLAAATFFHPDRISRTLLRSVLADAAGWAAATFERAAGACADLFLLQGNEPLSMHPLWCRFVREQVQTLQASALSRVRQTLASRFIHSAQEVADHPAGAEATLRFLSFALETDAWDGFTGARLVATDRLHRVGFALSQIGRFAEARPWYERAVAETERGDVQGRVDHESLGSSLHQVGVCLSQTGRYEEARPWYERAVAEAERGDLHGHIDHANLGTSLHQVGYCLSAIGQYEEARPWYERAVTEKEKGDLHGRINHANLGTSLHQVGYCLSGTGRYEEARPWYERAVAEKEQGDVHGRIDHESLGTSLHGVGHCLSRAGRYEEARPWYERAVAEAEQGDVHGRIDHRSQGLSLHQVGVCFSQAGCYEEARPWFERAVVEAEQGDVHGRIDHESLGLSLHRVGVCLSETGRYEEARPWHERAVAEKEQGDVHGRIDHASLERSRQALASVLQRIGG